MNQSPPGDGLSPTFAERAALGLTVLALVLACWNLFQLDHPLGRAVRDIDWPWFEAVGTAGYHLGSGLALVGMSLALLAVGVWRTQPLFRAAGIQTLIAHGVAALIVQTLKHLIGRPRPRLGDTQSFMLGPTFAEGLDSFPSGHATASFAVAAVLAVRFPKMAWVLYSVPATIAAGRVITGSHFPSDVVVGAVLGTLVGAVAAHPIAEWRNSLSRAIRSLGPSVIAVVAVLWVACHPRPDEQVDRIMLGAGAMTVMAGAAGRFVRLGVPHDRWWNPGASTSNSLVAVGLALTSGSLLVTVLVTLVAAAQELNSRWSAAGVNPVPSASFSYGGPAVECARLVGVIALIVAIQALKGFYPLGGS